ncbi:related to protein involved in cell growth [Fusarium mangiferae]|uniref:Related to protein involved in cell growth n=1 Tax=Fusarium mangiferae TaxID=192010 RepID=A0A1L7T0J7_FUSMA|nr:uncharacterized protein FMAN_04711 [Fusarium mangiferae]CVK88777.1 related to protein involved in cell growth [Fusarium mangiferae]
MATETTPKTIKRLIACCDGTWMDSDNGYEEAGLLRKEGSLQIPSNVTRISRCFEKRCSDGKLQVVNYESGVGTGSNVLDSITGGAFGMGLAERMRETYSFLCSNYMDGDEIILVGFSRGAFTVRSVAGMIGNLGLLTREGVEFFYPIFKDMQHWMDYDYEDPFPNIPFPDKPKGEDAADVYRARLEQLGYTRVRRSEGQGDIITIKAVGVWDTVGSLGIPRVLWLEKLGIRLLTFKWHDTNLSDRIEHAFQALALDETRPPFTPAVWERLPENKYTTDLRQVWFPGNHGNCGGGWEDQGMSNITLAWMMDQLASIGVEFDLPALERCFFQNFKFYHKTPSKLSIKSRKRREKTKKRQWAMNPIYENNRPFRPWGLGTISKAPGLLYKLSGQTVRTPGLYRPADRQSKCDKSRYLLDTNERIHSSVRIRLVCKGLGLNDDHVWDCPALLSNWKLKRTREKYTDPVPFQPDWCPNGGKDHMGHPNDWSKGRWVWEYIGNENDGPKEARQRIMVEEPLGPYERYLLSLSAGSPNVYHFADTVNS